MAKMPAKNAEIALYLVSGHKLCGCATHTHNPIAIRINFDGAFDRQLKCGRVAIYNCFRVAIAYGH